MTHPEPVLKCGTCWGVAGEIQVWDSYPSGHKNQSDCISELLRLLDVARKALEMVAADFDHDEDAHKYGTPCRMCLATFTLSAMPEKKGA